MTAASISTYQKGIRARTWYALYTLEITLAEFTGRPCSITTSDISSPIDTSRGNTQLDSDLQALAAQGLSPPQYHSPTSFGIDAGHVNALHFSRRVQLSILSHRVISTLYSVGQYASWSQVQSFIRQFEMDLQQWHANLPMELLFQGSVGADTADPKIELALYYWSIRMILYRTCLCDLEGRIENESESSSAFNRTAAEACVHAALALLDMLPDRPVPAEIYRVLPWWTLLHYICQGASVLLLELCMEVPHCRNQVNDIMGRLKKAMAYLNMMSLESLSAYKAWRICRQILADATAQFGLDLSDVPNAAPQPQGWNAICEASVSRALDSTEVATLTQPLATGQTLLSGTGFELN